MSSSVAICGSFSFDSVITPEGLPLTKKVGGNALWSSLGALAAGAASRVVAVIGSDYPLDVIDRIGDAGIDVSAVARIDRPHPVRLTFAHLPDGGRVQPVPDSMIQRFAPEVRAQFIDSTIDSAALASGVPTPEQIPSSWLSEITHWHLPLVPLHRHRSIVDVLAPAVGDLHTDCPARSDLLGAPYERLQSTLSQIDVFLPSTSDFDVIAPGATVADILRHLQKAGVNSLVLKCGADGVLIVDNGNLLRLAAFPGAPIDPTGAGDAFCGGFLAGRSTGLGLVAAAAVGAAVASFAVATADPLDLLSIHPDDVHTRARSLAAAAEPVGSTEPVVAMPGGPA